MQLSPNHIILTSSPDIADIAKPLKKLGIIHFTYGRSYNTGARVYLASEGEFLENYFKDKHYLSGNTECRPELYKEQAVLWSTLPNQKIIDDCSRSRNIDHGIFLFHPQQGYCECFSFATNATNDRIINTYLSKMDTLISFKEYFREKASTIINKAEKQKIVLPFNNKLDISKSLINNDTYHNTFTSHATLTKRQLECSYLLMQGNTIKEIANTLGLSTRTVEDYLSHVRSKLGCRNKTELIVKLSKYL